MIVKLLEVSSRMALEYFPKSTFHGTWSPEKANVGSRASFHCVES
jgi:hypothetical protein